MKVFSSNNKKRITLSRKEWEQIGKIAGWTPDLPFEKPKKDDYDEEGDYIEALGDFFEKVREHRIKIMEEWFAQKRRKNKKKMSWNVIPFARVQKIWNDYARTGIVRDVKGMDDIKNQMIDILAKLTASNEIAGHSNYSIEKELEEDMGRKMPDGQDFDFYHSYLETDYGTPISDYGLPQLEKIAEKLIRTRKPEEQLVLVDQMFNVVHQRGDLCALFLEGGEASLNILKG